MVLEIISSEQILFKGEVESVTLPGAKGSFTVLENHASLISTLDAGTIEYVTGGERHWYPSVAGLSMWIIIV